MRFVKKKVKFEAGCYDSNRPVVALKVLAGIGRVFLTGQNVKEMSRRHF